MYRQLPNGDLFVPRRSNIPPPCPDGYIRDGGDYWVFHICLQRCEHRKDIPDPTCNCRVVLWCGHHNKQIKLLECKECQWVSPKNCIQNTTTKI